MEKTEERASRDERFVSSVIARCQQDKGLAARLRRADNPATEYQSWDSLAGYGVDLEKEWERLPFATIAATIAKAKMVGNGSLSLGRAMAACYDDGNKSEQAAARLRRLLACDELGELCRILRPLLSLVASRVSQPLDCTRLLGQLRRFTRDAQRVKTQWAQEFYGHQTPADGNASDSDAPAKEEQA